MSNRCDVRPEKVCSSEVKSSSSSARPVALFQHRGRSLVLRATRAHGEGRHRRRAARSLRPGDWSSPTRGSRRDRSSGDLCSSSMIPRRLLGLPAVPPRSPRLSRARSPAALELALDAMAAPRLDRPQFALELDVVPPAIVVELTRLERLAHRAVGLGGVRAVVEATLRRQLGDVGERAVDVPLRSAARGARACR